MKLFFLRLTALHQLHPLHPSSQVCILPGLTKTYRVFNSASKCIEAQYILCANTKNTNSKIQISKGLREDTFTDLSILHLNALRHNTFNRQKKTKESSRVLMDLYLYSYRIRICIWLGPEPAFGRLGLGWSLGGYSSHGYTSHASLRAYGAQLRGDILVFKRPTKDGEDLLLG